ncbi:MAG: methyl-accepting chemotaxis protein [Leptolyngbyaceae cyanobacterium SM1_4_3]|nr:methyl-accepting chemotaxis protein [Leptolyngbyaceae cyanobacterium SM1_4_3]
MFPVLIVGTYSILSSSGALSNLAETKLEEAVADDAESILAILQGINEDVLFLSETPPVQGIIRARDGGSFDEQGKSSYNEWVGQLETTFAAMMEQKPYYMQLRYLDETGQELVRVDSDGTNVKIISSTELQNKGDRPYFTETMQLVPGVVYTSPVELNQERGQIETPYKPTIRYATPVFDQAGTKRGIVIANVFANEFLKLLEEQSLGGGESIYLINQDGFYLSHPNPEKEWGVDLKRDERLENDYPAAIAEQILSNEQGLIRQGTDQLIAYQRIVPNPDQSDSLTVVTQAPKRVIFSSVNSLKLVSALIILVSLATVLPIGIVRARQLTNLIKELIGGISASSQQNFSALEEQERIASQQAASVNETTTTMDELEASFRQSAEQAKAAAAAARQALELTETGTKAVEENLGGMFTLEKKVGTIADQMLHLSEQANQIGSISQLVSDLANQTNMLALNSAVEAVRAGEHGKGFSVVANEIRRLADQSQRSAEKIGKLVSEIQSSINSTVMVTEEGTKTVATGVQIAQRTEQAFAGVEEAVNKVVLNNQQISLNLKQQLDGIQQVVQAMDVINKGAKETAVGINQTKMGTQQLTEVAMKLKQTV